MNFRTLGCKAWLLSAFLFADSTLMAHGGRASKEFFHLKQTADWISFIENSSYLEVIGTRFVAMEMASDSERTCLFGFNQPTFRHELTSKTHTGFVCFDSGRYEVTQKKEYCVVGELGCEIDPAGISIGIGNIEIVEPTFADLLKDLEIRPAINQYFSRYPKAVSVKFNPPQRLRPAFRVPE